MKLIFNQPIANNDDISVNYNDNIPEDILDMASKDQHLGEFDPSNSTRAGIYYKGDLVGFFSPQKYPEGWDTGATFILPDFRRKGIASSVLKHFYQDKKASPIDVDNDNTASRKTLEKVGFKAGKDNAMYMEESITMNFESFIHSLKRDDNTSLLEAILEGYDTLFKERFNQLETTLKDNYGYDNEHFAFHGLNYKYRKKTFIAKFNMSGEGDVHVVRVKELSANVGEMSILVPCCAFAFSAIWMLLAKSFSGLFRK
jgi:GNAT superfamily N-acetyltransferase